MKQSLSTEAASIPSSPPSSPLSAPSLSQSLNDGSAASTSENSAAETSLDRIARKTELAVARYVDNQEILYRPFLKLCLIVYVFELCWVIGVNASLFSDDSTLSPKLLFWIGLGVVYKIAMIGLARAVKARLTQKKQTGITLYAVFLVANFVGLHILLFGLGIYTALNEKFRTQAKSWSPTWYRELAANLD